MKFLNTDIWDSLNLPDWRAKFFIESYLEALSIETPHFHQAKLMSIIDLANEVTENITIYQDNNKGKGYLTSSLKELKKAFETDIVAKKIFSDIKDFFINCSKDFTNEKFTHLSILQLSILCKRIVSQEEIYFQEITTMLKNIILDTVNLTQKDRLTKEINSLTRIYVSYLLSKGYSPTFLFNKGEFFTRKSNYANRNFNQQFDMFLQTLNCKIRKFNVFYALKTNKIKTISEYITFKKVEILKEIPEKHFTISNKTFSKFDPDFYLKLEIESLDYISAAWKAKDIVEIELDYLFTFSSNINLFLHTSCYVDYKASGNTFQREVKIELLNQLISKDQRKDSYLIYLNGELFSKLEKNSRKKFESAIKKIRLSNNTTSLEYKLINIWIAFEILNYQNSEQSIISNIINFTPKIYAIKSIKDRVKYILNLLIKSNITIPQNIKSKHHITDDTFNQDFNLEKFFDIIKSKDDATEIYTLLLHKKLDLINFRLISLHELIKDDKCIKNRIKNTKEDVERHIYRIYRYRNSIVHNGHTNKLNSYALNHLIDYVNLLLLTILDTIKNSKHLNHLTLDDILLSSNLIIENEFLKMENPNFIFSFDSFNKYHFL